MGRWSQILVLVLMLMLVLLVLPVVAWAQGTPQGGVEDPTGISEIDNTLVALGLGTLVMLLVEIVKRLGVLPDGTAGAFAAILGVSAYLLLLILGFLDVDVTTTVAEQIVQLLTTTAQMALTVISALGSFGLLRNAEILPTLKRRT